MPDSSSDRDPLERLAEEFVARYRRGERPSLTEYAERHPELAEQVRDLFPALVEMEQLKPATADHTGAFTPAAEPTDPARVGEFRILRRVGQGGMGVVFEAVQESLGRHVALKLLPPEALLDPRRLERFRREAKSAARLHHTNIVPVFGVGEADGRHFYAMQFIDGHPLDAVIDEVKRLKEKSQVLPAAPRAVSEVAAALVSGTFAASASSTPTAVGVLEAPSSAALSGSISGGGSSYWATVARIGAQVADGLAYAHGQGVLHRDIKPANLLLDLRGTVWVTDFGLAKATDADDLTHAGDIVGTLRYMAPERFDGHGDHRADVYALGLTLYELLTLRPAFAADNRAKLVEQVVAANPKKPRSIDKRIPRDLETIVLKAIARDPAMRYQSASELADDLRRFTEDRPIHARRASAAEQAFRWCRRNPSVAGLVGLILLLMAGVTVGSMIAASHFDRLARRASDTADAEAAARRDAEAQEKETDRQRKLVEWQRRAVELQVARQYGEAGNRLAADGDVAGAVLWNVEGLKVAERNAEPELSNLFRTQLGQLLRQTPVPIHTWFHDASVSSFVIDPTGRTAAVVATDGKVFIHNIESGSTLGPLDVKSRVEAVEFSRDGSRLLTYTSDRRTNAQPADGAPEKEWRPEMRVWSVADGRPLTNPVAGLWESATPNGYTGINDVHFYDPVRPRENRFFCLGDTRVAMCTVWGHCKLFDAATGEEAETVLHLKGANLTVAAVSPDGKRLLVRTKENRKDKTPKSKGGPSFGRDWEVYTFRVIDVSDPKKPAVKLLKVPAPGGDADPSWAMFGPTGDVFARDETGVRVFDAAGKTILDQPALDRRPSEVGFLPSMSIGGGGASLRGSGSRYLSTVFTPDGRSLLIQELGTGTPGPSPIWSTRLVELATGKQVELPQTISSPIQFGPSGRYLLAVAAGRLGVFDVSTGSQVCQLPADLVFHAARLSPDGRYVLVTNRDNVVRVFSASTGQRAFPLFGHESPVRQAEFTPDGSRLVTAAGSMRVWPLARRDHVIRAGKEQPDVFISPDGGRLVTLAPRDEKTAEVRAWNATGEPLSETVAFVGSDVGRLRGLLTPSGMFDPSGRWLLLQLAGRISGRGPTGVFDTRTGKLDVWPTEPLFVELERPGQGGGPWPGGLGPVNLAWAPGRDEGAPAILRIANLERASPKLPADVRPDAGQLPTLRIIGPDGKALTPEVTFPATVWACWAPDGRHIATVTLEEKAWRCALWEFQPGRLEKVRDFPAVPAMPIAESLFRNVFSGHNAPPASFSADGKRVLFTPPGSAGTVRVWDVATGAQVGPLEQLAATGFRTGSHTRLGPDGTVLFTLGEQQQNAGVRATDVATGKELAMIVPSDGVVGFDVSLDGKRVLTWSSTGAQLWDVATGNLLAALKHEIGVSFAKFSADGRRVIARTLLPGERSQDRGATEVGSDLRIWDAATAQPVFLGVGGTRSQSAPGRTRRINTGQDGESDVHHDANGTRVVQSTASGEVVIHDLIPDPRPATELQTLAETLAARRVSGGGGLVVLKSDALAGGWKDTATARGGWGIAITGKDWHNERVAGLAERVAPLSQPGGTLTPASPGALSAGFGEWHVSGVEDVGVSWHLDRYLALEPADRDKRVLRARAATARRDWEQVVADLTDLPDGTAQLVDLYQRGRALAELGRWEDARTAFRAFRDAPSAQGSGTRGYVPLALIELRFGDRKAFRQIMDEAEAARDKADKTPRSPGGLLWPTLLVDAPPPKPLAAMFATPPKDSNPEFRFSGTPFPLEAGVAYRSGDSAKVLALLEKKFATDAGCTTPECFLLAMAAKKSGKDELAGLALARGIAQMDGTAKEPTGAVFPRGSNEPEWQKRVANDFLRREAEEVVRGKKP